METLASLEAGTDRRSDANRQSRTVIILCRFLHASKWCAAVEPLPASHVFYFYGTKPGPLQNKQDSAELRT